MKKLFKSFLFVILCFCLVLPFAGCSEKKYGGIVTSVKADEEHPIIINITLNDKTEYERYVFPYFFIFKDEFETYGSKNIDELLKNKDFLANKDNLGYFRQSFLVSSFGKAYALKDDDIILYMVLYEGFAESEITDLSYEELEEYKESYFNNLDYSSYIGWIKF